MRGSAFAPESFNEDLNFRITGGLKRSNDGGDGLPESQCRGGLHYFLKPSAQLCQGMAFLLPEVPIWDFETAVFCMLDLLLPELKLAIALIDWDELN